jgi:RNA polymerase sigma-70 factor (ECF subfamily)
MTTETVGYVPADLEQYRRELTGYCYRMLGSAFEADDAVQDTLVRAWKGLEKFEGRSSLRSWLYRIATNVCLEMLGGRNRRARPMDLNAAVTADSLLDAPLAEVTWIGPVPDDRIMTEGGDPAEVAVARESVKLAFVAALQHLAPRQRAVLILREVLNWKASEVAELLGTTVASVNSALQRARATLGAVETSESEALKPMDSEQRELLERYVRAFESYDLTALTALLHEDATLSMPPYELWVRGIDQILGWMSGPGHECAGSRLIPVVANGMPAFAQYRVSRTGEGHDPWGLQIIEVRNGKIVGLNTFLAPQAVAYIESFLPQLGLRESFPYDTEALFPLFNLPSHLEPGQSIDPWLPAADL